MVLTAPLSSQPLHAIRVLISTCDWNLTKDNQSFESSCHWQFIPPNLFPGVLKEISGRDFKNDSSTSFNFNLNCTLILVQTIHIRHWQLIRSKLERMTRVRIHWKIPTLGPRDLPQHWFCIPRPWRLPLGFALGQSLGPRDAKFLLRQISWYSGYTLLSCIRLYWAVLGCTDQHWAVLGWNGLY